ncbi:lecithin retinol acyltransferase domain-containing protein [Ditylenchus destructor]|uniref:Lecithin retinol acyltransferase domain-containing protein n=1 Tax=Ditylenchus destructor TaxID=166010 RepID=A0AAD4MDL3_9BILA|nr:lecithin retinol acyltransferase domain-containing protein [Ditylenchus destructor]
MLYIGTVDDELAKQNDKPFGDSVKKADRNKRMYIHFTHLNGGEVKMHSLLNTKRDSPLRINNLTQWQMPSFPPKDAIKRAIDSLGCRIKFEMVRRNCQHFVFSIKHGVSFIPIGEGYSCFNKDKFRNHSVHNVLPGSAKLKQMYSTKDAPPNSVFVQVHGESWVNVIEDYMPTLIVDTEANTVDFSVVPPDAWELNWALLKFIHEKVKEIWTLKLTKDGQALKEPALRNALNALTVLEWNFLVQQMYTISVTKRSADNLKVRYYGTVQYCLSIRSIKTSIAGLNTGSGSCTGGGSGIGTAIDRPQAFEKYLSGLYPI